MYFSCFFKNRTRIIKVGNTSAFISEPDPIILKGGSLKHGLMHMDDCGGPLQWFITEQKIEEQDGLIYCVPYIGTHFIYEFSFYSSEKKERQDEEVIEEEEDIVEEGEEIVEEEIVEEERGNKSPQYKNSFEFPEEKERIRKERRLREGESLDRLAEKELISKLSAMGLDSQKSDNILLIFTDDPLPEFEELCDLVQMDIVEYCSMDEIDILSLPLNK